ncbi:SHOCT domain-containing protein [Vallitalea maricola]|uniref:Uncharacterized protein n=1 Tax=Vallitalea maricola TaxID=3074433 RepID=A0ACB5UPH7_9FIRM|nr:hypothetical protein AN2V17_40960 [Vallitalea sp. AN17-2]
MMLIGWFVIGLIIYYFFKGKESIFTNISNAESKLVDRYVNGEIDDETYLKMKETINK